MSLRGPSGVRLVVDPLGGRSIILCDLHMPPSRCMNSATLCPIDACNEALVEPEDVESDIVVSLLWGPIPWCSML